MDGVRWSSVLAQRAASDDGKGAVRLAGSVESER
jgi:hypothetical protein